jgi:hypothetical protein
MQTVLLTGFSENPVNACTYYHASREQRGSEGHFYGDRKPWRYGFQAGLEPRRLFARLRRGRSDAG